MIRGEREWLIHNSVNNKISIGTAQFGLEYGINNQRGVIPKKEALQILDLCLKNNITHIDTSPVYGSSENLIGVYNKKQHFNITTKYSEKRAADINSNSLGFKKVYAYLVHHFESYKANSNIWSNMEELRNTGRVQKIGFSLYYPEQLEDLLDSDVDFNIVQVPYSILDQRFAEYFRELSVRGIEIQVRSVFLQGLVFKNCDHLEKFDSLKDNLTKLNNMCCEYNVPISSLCICFALLNKHVDRVVLGVNSLEELKSNLIYYNNFLKVGRIYDKLLKLHKNDDKMIVPLNWKS